MVALKITVGLMSAALLIGIAVLIYGLAHQWHHGSGEGESIRLLDEGESVASIRAGPGFICLHIVEDGGIGQRLTCLDPKNGARLSDTPLRRESP